MEDHHELTHLATVLAAAFIGGAVFKKLHQPVLVGYIIVGLILGPSVLGVVEGRKDVSMLAELGILLLLFIVGMEMDLKNFKSVSRVSLVTCGAQIGIGLISMIGLGLIFGWAFNTMILLGFAVALSSTAVALKLLEDMGLRGTKIGQNSVGILIAQDLAVIPMILIIGALATADGFNYEGMARLFVAIVLMGGVMYLLQTKPGVFKDIWAKFESFAGDMMKGQTTITALAFCFTASAVAGLFGLSAAYGAFLAGIVLGQTVSRDTVHKQTQPVFDVMIMVFFLSIGLLIDLGFLAEHWVPALTVLFITMLLKTVVNVFVLRKLGVEKNEAYVTGAVLAQVGEFSFILAAMGLSMSTIDEISYKYVVAIITLSLLATPLWLYLVKRFDVLQQVDLRPLAEKIKKRAPRKKAAPKKAA